MICSLLLRQKIVLVSNIMEEVSSLAKVELFGNNQFTTIIMFYMHLVKVKKGITSCAKIFELQYCCLFIILKFYN
jgi:hypothetical protein